MVAVKTNLEWMLCKHSADYRDPKKGSGVLNLSIYKGPDETVIVVETRLFPPSLGGLVVLLTLVAGATRVSPPNPKSFGSIPFGHLPFIVMDNTINGYNPYIFNI